MLLFHDANTFLITSRQWTLEEFLFLLVACLHFLQEQFMCLFCLVFLLETFLKCVVDIGSMSIIKMKSAITMCRRRACQLVALTAIIWRSLGEPFLNRVSKLLPRYWGSHSSICIVHLDPRSHFKDDTSPSPAVMHEVFDSGFTLILPLQRQNLS